MKPTNNSLAITPENLQLQLSIGLFEYTDTPIRPGVSTVTYTGQSGNHMWTDSSRPITHVKVRTLDIAPVRESSPQKRSGMARVLKGFHSFTCTPTRSSAIGMSHTCLCLPTQVTIHLSSLCNRCKCDDFPLSCSSLTISLH